MARRFSWFALVVVLVAGAAPLRASSIPWVQGQVAGIELCEQAVCGAAYFVGFFAGQVGFNPWAIGTIAVAVTHETPLPDPNDFADVTGGRWQLQLLSGKTLAGAVTGGSLFNNNGDGTYHVIANMLVTRGGVGTLTFEGTLSHNTFPPTIGGQIKP
jgi:hypothetical protein